MVTFSLLLSVHLIFIPEPSRNKVCHRPTSLPSSDQRPFETYSVRITLVDSATSGLGQGDGVCDTTSIIERRSQCCREQPRYVISRSDNGIEAGRQIIDIERRRP